MKERLSLTIFALFLFSNHILVFGQVSKIQWSLPTIDDEKKQVSFLSGIASFNKIPTEITGLEVTGIMPIKCVMRRDYGQINVYVLYESPVRIYEIHYKGQDFITKQFQEILPTSVSKINMIFEFHQRIKVELKM